MKCSKESMLLYAVTDRMWVGEQTLYEQVESALKGGATCIQLREKELDDPVFLDEAAEMRKLCKKYEVPLIINDNPDVAVKSGADGVHVGQSDMKAEEIRKIPGHENLILGVSVRTVEQAAEAEKSGADYLGVGAVFPTSTKLDADSVTYETLKRICEAVSIPVVAIGGINRNNILRLSKSGVDGVALVSAIFAAKDIEAECRELKKLSEKMVSER